MGQVKNFAIWLSECVYERNMSNEAIMSALANQYPDSDLDPVQDWVLEQIRVVRAHPQLYCGNGTEEHPPCMEV